VNAYFVGQQLFSASTAIHRSSTYSLGEQLFSTECLSSNRTPPSQLTCRCHVWHVSDILFSSPHHDDVRMDAVHRAKQAPSTAQHDNEERESYASTRGWKWATLWRDGRCTAQRCMSTLQLPANTHPFSHKSGICHNFRLRLRAPHRRSIRAGHAQWRRACWRFGARNWCAQKCRIQMNSCPECSRHALKTRAISTRAWGGDDVLTRVCTSTPGCSCASWRGAQLIIYAVYVFYVRRFEEFIYIYHAFCEEIEISGKYSQALQNRNIGVESVQ
jgi:hypothetical protein